MSEPETMAEIIQFGQIDRTLIKMTEQKLRDLNYRLFAELKLGELTTYQRFVLAKCLESMTLPEEIYDDQVERAIAKTGVARWQDAGLLNEYEQTRNDIRVQMHTTISLMLELETDGRNESGNQIRARIGFLYRVIREDPRLWGRE